LSGSSSAKQQGQMVKPPTPTFTRITLHGATRTESVAVCKKASSMIESKKEANMRNAEEAQDLSGEESQRCQYNGKKCSKCSDEAIYTFFL
jgi:hypothetical protein